MNNMSLHFNDYEEISKKKYFFWKNINIVMQNNTQTWGLSNLEFYFAITFYFCNKQNRVHVYIFVKERYY